MYIAIKKRNNRANESLVVFEFMSQEEANDFFAGMNKFIENDGIPQKFKEMMAEPLKRLESRCDDKYSNDTSNDDLDVIKSFRNIEKYLASIPGIKDDSFNYLLQNMKIKDYYAWSLHYISPSASSRTLRKRLFKKFHREILKDGKKYKKYLSTGRLTELEETEKRYRLSFLYLSSIYIAFKRKTKRKESEYI